MNQEDFVLFNLLKREIVSVMKKTYPGINSEIAEWKGQEIIDFQEELRSRVKGHISEKWFYSHMKNSGHNLPRIDVLNLLSRFAGYLNWEDFRFRNSSSDMHPAHYTRKANRLFVIVPLIALLIMLGFYGLFRLINIREYRFCFIDAETNEPVTGLDLQVEVLNNRASPSYYNCSADGCFTLRTDIGKIRMVVHSPYYQPDTIEKVLKKFNLEEKVELRADNYALMIRYFSEKNVVDWKKRRTQLGNMIADDALIYRVIGNSKSAGMELFSKGEFIDKLTLPAGSLRELEILSTKYKEGRIAMLCFRIGEDYK